MQRLLLLCFIVLFYACEKNETIDYLPKIKVSETINLNLPQYQNLLTPNNPVYTNGGLKGILIYNTGSTPKYKAFERACPNNDCNSPMTFDGSLKMKCPCDLSEYSIYDGSLQPERTGGNFAREYRVLVLNSTTLNITNY